MQNIQFAPKVPIPIAEFAKNVSVHSGFSNYLFRYTTGDNEKTKYEQILVTLKEVFNYKEGDKDYSDYSLYVTGHSLGGAITQILAFTLAGSKTARSIIPNGNPVTALTYASPECGTGNYREAFKKLEFENRLRHLRISNHGDGVPIAVSSINRLRDYTQPGVNIHLHKNKKADVTYNGNVRYWVNPFNALTKHSLADHKFNLLDNGKNEDILEKAVETFYEEYLFKSHGSKLNNKNEEL